MQPSRTAILDRQDADQRHGFQLLSVREFEQLTDAHQAMLCRLTAAYESACALGTQHDRGRTGARLEHGLDCARRWLDELYALPAAPRRPMRMGGLR